MPVDKDELIIPRLSTLQPIEEQLGRGFPTFIDPEYVSDWDAMNIKPVLSADAEATFEGECIVNAKKMWKLIDRLYGNQLFQEPDWSHMPDPLWTDKMAMSFTCNSPAMVPVRKHRKKRIAKKWAKKYGYRYEFREIRLRDVAIVRDNDGFDILGKEFVVR